MLQSTIDLEIFMWNSTLQWKLNTQKYSTAQSLETRLLMAQLCFILEAHPTCKHSM